MYIESYMNGPWLSRDKQASRGSSAPHRTVPIIIARYSVGVNTLLYIYTSTLLYAPAAEYSYSTVQLQNSVLSVYHIPMPAN